MYQAGILPRRVAVQRVRIAVACKQRALEDTRLWAALQNVSGGTWGGCVYDVEAILAKLNA